MSNLKSKTETLNLLENENYYSLQLNPNEWVYVILSVREYQRNKLRELIDMERGYTVQSSDTKNLTEKAVISLENMAVKIENEILKYFDNNVLLDRS